MIQKDESHFAERPWIFEEYWVRHRANKVVKAVIRPFNKSVAEQAGIATADAITAPADTIAASAGAIAATFAFTQAAGIITTETTA